MKMSFKGFLEKYGLISHQILPFNELINGGFQRIIDSIEIERVKFGKITIERPEMFENGKTRLMLPEYAEMNSTDYSGNISIEATLDGETRSISLGSFPVMVGSCICNEKNPAQKGYFIINGGRRILISTLIKAYNTISVFEDKSHIPTSEIRTSNGLDRTMLVQCKFTENEIFFSVPYIKTLIPAGNLFRSLGVTFEEIEELLFLNPENKKILRERFNQYTQEEAKAFIESLIQEKSFEDILFRYCFLNVKNRSKESISAQFCFLVSSLMDLVEKRCMVEDKNSISFKRVNSSKLLIEILLKSAWKQTLMNIAQKEKIDFNCIKEASKMKSIRSCFATGMWSIDKIFNNFIMRGISQINTVQNDASFISLLRRIMIPIRIKGLNTNMISVNSTQQGFLCPFETPDGPKMGITLNFSISTIISSYIEASSVRESIFKCKYFSKQFLFPPVCFNGEVIGSAKNKRKLMKELEELRKEEKIHPHTSIVYIAKRGEIHLYTDEGRMLRPVFVVKDSKLLFKGESWEEAEKRKSIVFRDPLELEESVISEGKNYKNCDYSEIFSGYGLCGILSASIPFVNHSQSPRISYQAGMCKQAIGLPSLDYQKRVDCSSMNVLDYPQRAIAYSDIFNLLGFNENSFASLPVVLIATMSGFNQEDAVILNKSSIERGLFSASCYKVVKEFIKVNTSADILLEFLQRN